MSEIGIRELKAKASEPVRRVAEDHAVYTITRSGRPVGVLAPQTSRTPRSGRLVGRLGRRLAIVDRMANQPSPRKSALTELSKMRSHRDNTLHGGR